MNRREHDAQRLGVEHHRDARRAGQVREQLRVPAPRQPGGANASLLIGAVAIASMRPACASRRRRDDGVVGRAARSADTRPRSNARDVVVGRRSVEDRLAQLDATRGIGRRLARDLRPDAGGIADGDADARRARSSAAIPQPPAPHDAAAAAAARARSDCCRIRSRLRRRSRRASRPCRSAARSGGSTSAGRTCPTASTGSG